MRLFIAVNFSEEINNSLEKIIQGLKGFAQQGNFTRKENFHLTLIFIGETPRIAAVKKAMDGVDAPRFNLTLDGLGKFCREGGDIYWLGVKHNTVLNQIHRQFCNILSTEGFAVNRQEYKPHLTLGRRVLLCDDFNQQAFEKTIPQLRMEVSKISLMRSERLNGQLTYTEIYSKKLDS